MEAPGSPLSTVLPILTVNNDTDTDSFDYDAFLQDIDTEQPAINNSSGLTSAANGLSSSSSSSGSTPLPDAVVTRKSAQKQRLGRRGHTKSRRGCYNCKKRRIKVIINKVPRDSPSL
ncbi:hypothetical protein F4810DRAFT_646338 [Camillea tinctor]|nr:hypothetical protein F4810DRAFT_646338 [Camillea tinctor]